jgi:hypothetical protein
MSTTVCTAEDKACDPGRENHIPRPTTRTLAAMPTTMNSPSTWLGRTGSDRCRWGEAIWQKGMFANQNTVVRLRDPFTLERLMEAFGLDNEQG